MNANRILLSLVILTALVWTCSFQVAEAETALVTRFGGVQRAVVEPGLHFKLPIDEVTRLDRRLRVLEVDVGEVLTAKAEGSEAMNIEVTAFLGWSIADPERFVRSVRTVENAETSLRTYLDSRVGSILNGRPMRDLVGIADGTSAGPDLDSINAEILAQVTADTNDLGVNVVTAKLLRVGFPLQNKKAVYDRMSAERDGVAKAIQANASLEARNIENAARERNQKIVSEAQAEAKRIEGEAEAKAAEILREAAAADPEFFEWLMTLEVQRASLGEDDVIILPVDPTSPMGRLLQGNLGVGDKPSIGQ